MSFIPPPNRDRVVEEKACVPEGRLGCDTGEDDEEDDGADTGAAEVGVVAGPAGTAAEGPVTGGGAGGWLGLATVPTSAPEWVMAEVGGVLGET